MSTQFEVDMKRFQNIEEEIEILKGGKISHKSVVFDDSNSSRIEAVEKAIDLIKNDIKAIKRAISES